MLLCNYTHKHFNILIIITTFWFVCWSTKQQQPWNWKGISAKQSRGIGLPKASQLKDHWAQMMLFWPGCTSSAWQSWVVRTQHRQGEGNTQGKHSSNYKQALSWVWKQKWQQQWAARHTHKTHTQTHSHCVCLYGPKSSYGQITTSLAR